MQYLDELVIIVLVGLESTLNTSFRKYNNNNVGSVKAIHKAHLPVFGVAKTHAVQIYM
jgi:hypothetical protein